MVPCLANPSTDPLELAVFLMRGSSGMPSSACGRRLAEKKVTPPQERRSWCRSIPYSLQRSWPDSDSCDSSTCVEQGGHQTSLRRGWTILEETNPSTPRRYPTANHLLQTAHKFGLEVGSISSVSRSLGHGQGFGSKMVAPTWHRASHGGGAWGNSGN